MTGIGTRIGASFAACWRPIDAAIEWLGSRAKNLVALAALIGVVAGALAYFRVPTHEARTAPPSVAEKQPATECMKSAAGLFYSLDVLADRLNLPSSMEVEDAFREALMGKRVCLILEVEGTPEKQPNGSQRVPLRGGADFPLTVLADILEVVAFHKDEMVRMEGVLAKMVGNKAHRDLRHERKLLEAMVLAGPICIEPIAVVCVPEPASRTNVGCDGYANFCQCAPCCGPLMKDSTASDSLGAHCHASCLPRLVIF
jgi:hypothetical protein